MIGDEHNQTCNLLPLFNAGIVVEGLLVVPELLDRKPGSLPGFNAALMSIVSGFSCIHCFRSAALTAVTAAVASATI
jgi:hypothetical protein